MVLEKVLEGDWVPVEVEVGVLVMDMVPVKDGVGVMDWVSVAVPPTGDQVPVRV